MTIGGIMENTSGQGKAAVVPAEVGKWSWAGFLLNWIWGIFNGTFIALLALVPFVGLIMAVVLGVKGREWAWRNKKWDSIEHFRAVQRKWDIAAVIVTLILIAFLIALIALPIMLGARAQTQ
jgi:hypothetical protein